MTDYQKLLDDNKQTLEAVSLIAAKMVKENPALLDDQDKLFEDAFVKYIEDWNAFLDKLETEAGKKIIEELSNKTWKQLHNV